MRGIVASEPELEIVGEVGVDALQAAIQEGGVNVVILGTRHGGDVTGFTSLLRMHCPGLRVVTIDQTGGRATVYEPGAASCEVTELSPRDLIQMIRGTIQ